mgnify:CR=1 FL=1
MAKTSRYAVCVDNRGNPAALEVRKIYRLVAVNPQQRLPQLVEPKDAPAK